MKKVLLMAMVAIFTLNFSLEAQNNRRDNRQGARGGARWTPKERAEAMEKQLGLTADQKTKVLSLFEKQDEKRAEQIAQHRSERGNQTQDRAKRREDMRTLREKEIAENDVQLEKIIGKEKMEQWKKYRTERQKEMRSSNRAGRRAPQTP